MNDLLFFILDLWNGLLDYIYTHSKDVNILDGGCMDAFIVYGLSYHMDCFSVGRIAFSLICRRKNVFCMLALRLMTSCEF